MMNKTSTIYFLLSIVSTGVGIIGFIRKWQIVIPICCLIIAALAIALGFLNLDNKE